jgi:hypothetical protein
MSVGIVNSEVRGEVVGAQSYKVVGRRATLYTRDGGTRTTRLAVDSVNSLKSNSGLAPYEGIDNC